MGKIFFVAVALLLVMEGITPFLSPKRCRRMMQAISQCSDRALRIMGFVAMVLGVVIMYVVHNS
ncbi:MAG: DUF2065 domain-containing protein [Gammaproteobacteria bacterium]|nr:DUF2065 domain-containing protein [Gammaproteobacteria bacterium]